MAKYIPRPIEIDFLKENHLTEKLSPLSYELAKNIHEIWSKSRIEEGWSYGEKRDDLKKKHPGLVPFDELSKTEQSYDLKTAYGAINFILSKGFKIIPPEETKSYQHGLIKTALLNSIKNTQTAFNQLKVIWQKRNESIWQQEVSLYNSIAQRFISLSEPLLAYDVVTEGLKVFKGNKDLIQLKALALIRLEMPLDAIEELKELIEARINEEETLANIGRCYKDLYIQTNDKNYLELSLSYYQKSYALNGGIWSGINVASICLLKKDNNLCIEVADEVIFECELILKNEPENYWVYATLGEAFLLKGDISEAYKWYKKGLEKCKPEVGTLLSPLKNIELISKTLGLNKEQLNKLRKCFPTPDIILFSGHRIDSLGSPSRFPSKIESKIYNKIYETLKEKKNYIGFSSASSGADILFLEATKSLGNEFNIILPGEHNLFKKTSVEYTSEGEWGSRFEVLINKSTQTVYLSDNSTDIDEKYFEYAAKVTYGLARIKAKQLGSKLCPVALHPWKDMEPTSGGTATALNLWKENEIKHQTISYEDLIDSSLKKNYNSSNPKNDEHSKIMALFFADAVNFSKLRNEDYPLFNQEFWGLASKIIEDRNYKPILKNTWGDALYMVFPIIEQAGQFALEFAERVKNQDWTTLGFIDQLNIRIALHAGPVFSSYNPVTGKENIVGSNVCRAARIEPVTPPGSVFASREFAALSSAEHIKSYNCNYVGDMPMAKNYGSFPTYVVRRSNS